MSCGRVPEVWPSPLPRLAILPGDPPALRRELHAVGREQAPDTTDVPWPDEEAS